MKNFVGFNEALDLTLSHVQVAGTETLPLKRLTGRILSEDIVSKVDSPSTSTSLMDGYAVLSDDLMEAGRESLIKLEIKGHLTAGSSLKMGITRGQAIRVTTGAPIPGGADAVLKEEFCQPRDDEITCFDKAEPGQAILRKGTDIQRGETTALRGEHLSPPLIGLMASAGLAEAPVYRSPHVAVIATGDEVVAPGDPLPEGKLYASNMVEISSWLSMMGLPFLTELVPDRKEDIEAAIIKHLPLVNVFITSGGAWGSERDLIIRVLEGLNWQGVYHRVRMAPGKSVGFGLLEKNPFFCLPGGPSSNEMAFLQLALPGLLAMEGYRHPLFPLVSARLTETVRGHKDWTQFLHAHLVRGEDHLMVRPSRERSRLRSMARKEALIIIPEGCGELAEGEKIDIQLLTPFVPGRRPQGSKADG
jgi:molybdopterin molybdotransferase